MVQFKSLLFNIMATLSVTMVIITLTSCADVAQEVPSIEQNCQQRMVTFDLDPDGNAFNSGDLLNTQYSAWNVTFSLISVSPKIIQQSVDPSDAIPVSSPFLLGGNTTTGISSANPLTISFSKDTKEISFYIVDAEGGAGTAIFYDSTDQVLGTESFQSLGSGVSQKITSVAEYVRKILVTNSSAHDGFFVDNLEFTQCEKNGPLHL